MATFTWIPDVGADRACEPRINSVRFGEGYEQTAPDGINSLMEKRSLSFTGRSLAETQAIAAFLEAQGGVTSFDYTHPNSTAKKYRCKVWKVADTEGNHQSVTCEFQQVP